MKHDNDNSKTKHATQNLKHQKAVALRARWLEDNPEKTKQDWNFAQNLKEMQKKYVVEFKEEKANTLTRFLSNPSAKVASKASAKPFEGKSSVEVEFLICYSAEKQSSVRHVCDVKSVFLDNLMEIEPQFQDKSLSNLLIAHN